MNSLNVFLFLLLFSFVYSLPMNDYYITEKARYYHKINGGKRGDEVYIYENGKNKTKIIKSDDDIQGINFFNLKLKGKKGQNNNVQIYRIIENTELKENSGSRRFIQRRKNSRKNLDIGTRNINIKRTKKVYQIIKNVKVRVKRK